MTRRDLTFGVAFMKRLRTRLEYVDDELVYRWFFCSRCGARYQVIVEPEVHTLHERCIWCRNERLTDMLTVVPIRQG